VAVSDLCRVTRSHMDNRWPAIRSHLRAHGAFYGVSIALGLGLSAFFLLNRSAGPRWAWIGFPLDDAWIHMVYARSLAKEGWFFYNPGIPEAGMSSPLWVILLAGALKLSLSPALAGKSLSICLGLLVPILLYHCMLDVSDSRPLAWICGLTGAALPDFSFARVSGMEVTLVSFLVVLSCWLFLRRKYLGYGIVVGLGVIARGEVAVPAILFGGILLLREYLKRDQLTLATRDELLLSGKLFLPALILGGAWALYNFSISGNPLPNTYYVKHNFSLGLLNVANLYSIWMGYFRFSALTWHWLAAPMILLVILGAWRMVHESPIHTLPLLLTPWITAYALSTNVALNPLQWNFTARRYLDYVSPLLAVPLLIGAKYLWDRASEKRSRAIILGAPLLLGATSLAFIWASASQLNALAKEYSWNARNIQETNVALGKWMATNIPAGLDVGVTDAGAMRYFSEHRVIDLLGLNNHETLGRPLAELLREYRPAYVALFRNPEIDSWNFLREVTHIQPDRNTILGGSDLVIYEYVGDS
jgi:hypothetical protein